MELVIHDVTCSFRLVSCTAQNLVSRGLPIFGTFCKPLRNVVIETFAEPAANWEDSSNRILTVRPLGSFINVKLKELSFFSSRGGGGGGGRNGMKDSVKFLILPLEAAEKLLIPPLYL